MIDQELWLKRHRTGIGGSDAPAVLGVSPWKSRLGVWEEKVGEAPSREVSERMIWGSRLEKAILAGYAEDRGVKVRHVGFRRHPEIPYVIGHPDGLSTAGPLIECKTADHLSEEWGSEGSDQVPEQYWVQVQHYLLLMGLQEADLVLLVRGNTLRTFRIVADQNFTHELQAEEGSFWRDHVLAGVPPEPDGSEDARGVLRRMYRERSGEEIVANDVQRRMAWDLLDLKAQIRSEEERAREMENYLRAAMGSRSRMVGDGFSISVSRIDGRRSWKEIAQAYRDLIDQISNHEGVEHLGEMIGSEVQAVREGTVEGLYVGDPSDRFIISRKGKEGSDANT